MKILNRNLNHVKDLKTKWDGQGLGSEILFNDHYSLKQQEGLTGNIEVNSQGTLSYGHLTVDHSNRLTISEAHAHLNGSEAINGHQS